MRHTFTALLFLYAFAFISCHRENSEQEPAPEGTVDLGIVMERPDGSKYKLYWADRNLGADDPESKGDYYCWGEVEPDKPGHGLEQYKYGKGSYLVPYSASGFYQYMYVSRYCPGNMPAFWRGVGDPDNLTDLRDYGYEDDAARVVLGGKWHIPTLDEWMALRRNCLFTEEVRHGELFFRFKSKITGNALYLPAAGYCDNSPHYIGMNLVSNGRSGYYWASSIDLEDPSAARIWGKTIMGRTLNNEMGSLSRWFGASIRPVLEVDL